MHVNDIPFSRVVGLISIYLHLFTQLLDEWRALSTPFWLYAVSISTKKTLHVYQLLIVSYTQKFIVFSFAYVLLLLLVYIRRKCSQSE